MDFGLWTIHRNEFVCCFMFRTCWETSPGTIGAVLILRKQERPGQNSQEKFCMSSETLDNINSIE